MSLGRNYSRRDVLKTLPLAALAACRRRPYDLSEFPRPDRSPVSLLPATDYDLDFGDLITRGLQTLGTNVRGLSVLLKPNMVEYAPGAAINTHPAIVVGAAAAFLRAGAREVIVGEAPGHRRDIEYLLSATGLGPHLREMRLRFVDLNHDDVRLTPMRSRFMGLGELALPTTLLAADVVVSMPKLKTHHWAAMTCGMKNLFGVVPGAVYGWPKNFLHFHGIENAILDLVSTVRPHLTIVDAVVAMEGDGPIMGQARALGFVAMGSDIVAVDATCARAIGLDPDRIPYLAEASRFLGNVSASRIEQRGERLDRYQTSFNVLPDFAGLQLASGG